MKRKKKADLACRAVVRRGSDHEEEEESRSAVVRRGSDREEEEEGRSGGGGGERRWIPILG